MVTLTARHRSRHPLAPMLDAVVDGFRRLMAGRAAMAEKRDLGVVGVIRSLEITYGANGWHPHLHVLLLLAGNADTAAQARAIDRWRRQWAQFLAERGFEPSRERGVRWEPVTRGLDAGQYLAKVQDGSDLGMEMARGDLKAGRLGSLHPFELLDYFAETGDMDAVELWREYERATLGRKAITWTPGLRRRLLSAAEHKSDEEIVEEEVGGVDVCLFEPEHWDLIDRLNLSTAVLDAIEQADPGHEFEAVVSLLAPYGVTPLRPDG